MIKNLIPTTTTATIPSYAGMPVAACTAAFAVDAVVRVRRQDESALMGAVAGVKGGLVHIQTTTPGTHAWRPPIC